MQHVATLPSASPEETEELGRRLGRLLGPGHVVGLVGELGAGQTCFAQGVAAGLAVPPEIYVSSPTFTLVNEYPGRIPLYHIDLYRLSDAGELTEIGLQDCYRGDGACLVEWLDRFPDERPAERLEVELVVTGDSSRRLQVSAEGDGHLRLGRQWAASQGEGSFSQG